MEATLQATVAKKSTNVQSATEDVFAQLERWRKRIKLAERISSSLSALIAVEVFTTARRHKRPEREHRLLATGTRLDVGSDEFVAWSFGNGPTVLLVHGWEGRGAQLGALIEPLLQAGYRVVTFDAPAHGQSPGRTTTLTGFVNAMLQIKWRVGEIHAVVAHSFGCVAVCAALRRGLAPNGVVFIAPVAHIERGFEQFGKLMDLTPQTQQAMRRILEQRAGRSMQAFNPLAIAKETAVPLVIFHDRNDRDVPWQDGWELSRAWPEAKLQLTSGLNHHRILRDPEVVASSVEFIKSVAQEQPELDRRLSASGL
jgi:pimeloyl-ACP methyl ester carboxylesterase